MYNEIKSGYLPLNRLLKITTSLYKQKFIYILAINFLIYLPMQIIFYLNPEEIIRSFIKLPFGYDILLSNYLVLLFVFVIFEPLASAGISYICDGFVREQELSPAGFLDSTLLIWKKLILNAFLYVVFISIGSALFLIPGLICLVSFYFFATATVLTGKCGIPALKESARVLKGKFFKAVLVLIFVMSCSFLTSEVFSFFEMKTPGVLSQALNFIIGITANIAVTFFSVLAVIWYLNVYYFKQPNNNPVDKPKDSV